MAAPIIYRSSDGSAPILTGTAGDLVNLLDKCLVTGYGAKSAAGWTKPYTATNQAVFRQGAGNQFYLDVDDRGATSVLTSASGREAAIRGYEEMTAVSTGTNPFPTTAQVLAATANWRKSATADTVPRGWFVVADDRTFMLGILAGDNVSTYLFYYFGDVYSLKTSDGYRTIINVKTTVNTAQTAGTLEANISGGVSSTQAGWHVARIAAGTGTSATVGLMALGTTSPTVDIFPSAGDVLWLSRFMTTDSAAPPHMRGWLRGVYRATNNLGLNDGDTFTGTGAFAGRSFVIARLTGTGAALAIETTTWDTSS